MPRTDAKAPTMHGVVPPAPIALNDPDAKGLTVSEAINLTALDRDTILSAIHRGELPAWALGGDPNRGGFRMHRLDFEAWMFGDTKRAHTPGTGSPEGPITARRT